ncbi:MAG: hypothetical protein H0W72_11195, partial [Planctomycetes bacterium]|nr:hypothetical protein [Planctomycetota bacterium]
MNDQQRGSNAGNKRSASLGAVGALASQVKTRLAQDPSWQHFALNGAWICPYCLAGVRGHDDSRAALVRAIESHLARRCSVYRGGSGACHPDETIAAKKTFEDIAHRAASDAAWQVFDHEGFWYSPTSLKRVESVRLTNGRFDSFTIQAMVNHLGHCTAFQRGVVYPAATVQKARDQGMRAVSLAENLRELLQFPLWRYTNATGQWVCPFCLEHIPEVVLRGDADWTTAPEKMAWHLACSCATYVPERPEPKMEALVQQAAVRTSMTATPLSSGAIPRIGSGSSRTIGTPGTVRTTSPISGSLRRPNTPSGSAP